MNRRTFLHRAGIAAGAVAVGVAATPAQEAQKNEWSPDYYGNWRIIRGQPVLHYNGSLSEDVANEMLAFFREHIESALAKQQSEDAWCSHWVYGKHYRGRLHKFSMIHLFNMPRMERSIKRQAGYFWAAPAILFTGGFA